MADGDEYGQLWVNETDKADCKLIYTDEDDDDIIICENFPPIKGAYRVIKHYP